MLHPVLFHLYPVQSLNRTSFISLFLQHLHSSPPSWLGHSLHNLQLVPTSPWTSRSCIILTLDHLTLIVLRQHWLGPPFKHTVLLDLQYFDFSSVPNYAQLQVNNAQIWILTYWLEIHVSSWQTYFQSNQDSWWSFSASTKPDQQDSEHKTLLV